MRHRKSSGWFVQMGRERPVGQFDPHKHSPLLEAKAVRTELLISWYGVVVWSRVGWTRERFAYCKYD